MVSVYITKQINLEGLMKIYEILGRKARGKVAVKLTSGWNPVTAFIPLNLPSGLAWAAALMNSFNLIEMKRGFR